MRPPSRGSRARRALAAAGAAAFALLAYIYLTLPDVRALARENPTTTAYMELRAREAEAAGRKPRRSHRWVPYARISRNLTRAVVVAEDAAFWDHDGLDYREIRNAVESALAEGGELRGASTITQQLARNLYLSPSRDPLRKLRELFITRRLEAALTKTRILEIYLNVVEWGDGIWGADAAARAYFGVPASALTRQQAALLAGALINPIVYSPARPPARLLRRQRIILSRMGAPAQSPAPDAPPRPAAPSDAASAPPAREQAGGAGAVPPADGGNLPTVEPARERALPIPSPAPEPARD